MAGIYIHIPYCKQKCIYCDFHFRVSQKDKKEMLKSMHKEIKSRRNYLVNEKIETIYFGGGTPSILKNYELKKLLELIYSTYDINDNIEITVECNPDDLTSKKLLSFKNMGVNRLSIGVQSFNDKELKFMNRSHNALEAVKGIKIAQKIGFNNITIDLIYGIPHQTINDWEKNIDQALSLNIQHFSAYSLTVEKKTVLSHMVNNKKIKLLSDEIVVNQFNLLQKKAAAAKFIHYEISNFGKIGYFSQHNTGYWKSVHYLGIGPSAHSYNGISRRSNISSNKKYRENIDSNKSYFKEEVLSITEQYNEYIFTTLRTIWGSDISVIKEKYGDDIEFHFLCEIKKWKAKKYIVTIEKKYKLSSKGMIFADKIASDLFIV